jgi:hypothetical protein
VDKFKFRDRMLAQRAQVQADNEVLMSWALVRDLGMTRDAALREARRLLGAKES